LGQGRTRHDDTAWQISSRKCWPIYDEGTKATRMRKNEKREKKYKNNIEKINNINK
jgi:hypothetical protein